MGSCWSAKIKADENDHSSLQSQYALEANVRFELGTSKLDLGYPEVREEWSVVTNHINQYDTNKVQSTKAETVRLSLKSEGEILQSSNLKSFTYNDLKIATRNFRPDSLLGEGGFGCVFKGWIDEHTFAPAEPNTGMVIAVKKLNEEGFQGHKEWLTEIAYLGQLQHPNLVKLIGYCLEDEQHLLVYEFMPHCSLENHLFNRSPHVEPLSWNLRMKIALGAAKGLAFLHSPKIKVIYRDFKASNILLDSDYNAKLSDFGLAKDGPFGEKSYVSTRVMGTHGYAAPEYMASGHLTARSDIYSFGVVLLEIMTGRRVLDSKRSSKEENLLNWAKPYLRKGNISRIMDSRIQGQYSSSSAKVIGNLVIQCLSVDPRFRPNMNEILSILEQLQESDQSGDLYPVNSGVKRRYHSDKLNQKTEHEHCRRPAHVKELCKVEPTISPNLSSPPLLVTI